MTKQKRRDGTEPQGKIEQADATKIAAAVERLTAVMDDPLTPGEIGLKMREVIADEMERMLDRLDYLQPVVIRRLFPLLMDFQAAGLIHDLEPSASPLALTATSR